MNVRELTGQVETHLVEIKDWNVKIHKEAEQPLRSLAEAAAKHGCELYPCSAFRGFEAQLKIWNAKARGERPLLDSNGQPLDYSSLKHRDLVYAILRWSALPGASRHHWGTDFDVIDRSTIPKDYKVQLVPAEFAEGGIFSKLHEWLDSHMTKFLFYRPYATDFGGIAPERWHLSYEPVAAQCASLLTLDALYEVIEQTDMELKQIVLKELPTIYSRFIKI